VRLQSFRLARFRNIVNPQGVVVEEDVTCLVGKNESGKTTVLEALHRLNPANHRESKFDRTTEYPRWRLVRDGRVEDLDKFEPINATFLLDEGDLDACAEFLPARPPVGTVCILSRTYDNTHRLGLSCSLEEVIKAAARAADVADEDAEPLLAATSHQAATATAEERVLALREQNENARAKTLQSFPSALDLYAYLTDAGLSQEQRDELRKFVPKFFYFGDYELLPGESDLNLLAQKVEDESELTPEEESVLALLNYAEAEASDFLGENYDARKAQLQASALDLTAKVFTYWSQNRDLEVDFDSELEEVGRDETDHPIMHRMLKVLMRDNRHGGIVTRFVTRSAGFRWFFSFLAAFSKYQESHEPVIVLLDEPGTSLHGEAQKDFLRFIFNELGASQQVVYTTHSQYMIDPSRYEKFRAVEDRSTRENPDLGVAITPVDVSADRDTILPLQAALGYSINQHLFIGTGRHLTVEGGSDFVYLDRVSKHLASLGRTALDPRLKILPVGGASVVPAFVALLGRDLEVSVLLDGNRQGKDAQRVLAQAAKGVIREDEVVVVSDVPGTVPKADVEDLFDPEDYLKLFNWAFSTKLSVADLPRPNERIVPLLEQIHGVYDHVLPAHALTEHRDEFFSAVSVTTLDRFEELFKRLNATIPNA
jgi:energy-coupling factor transporter ATP-binding protein EcfA2